MSQSSDFDFRRRHCCNMSTLAVHLKHGGGTKQLSPGMVGEGLDSLKKWLGYGEHVGGDGREFQRLSSGSGGGGSSHASPSWVDLRASDACDLRSPETPSLSSESDSGEFLSQDTRFSDVLTPTKENHLVGDRWSGSEARKGLINTLVSERNKREHFIMGCLESILLADKRSSSSDGSPFSGQSWASSSSGSQEDSDGRRTQVLSPSLASDIALLLPDGLESDRPSPESAESVSIYLGHASQPTTILESLDDDVEVEEPLFWPFDNKSYSLLDIDGNVFCTSPPKPVVSLAARVGRRREPKPRTENQAENRRQQSKQRLVLFRRGASVGEPRGTRDYSKPHTPTTTTTTTGCGRSNQAWKQKSRVPSIHPNPKVVRGRPDRGDTEGSFPPPTYVELTECALLATNAALMERMIGLGEFDGTEGVASCVLDSNWLSDD